MIWRHVVAKYGFIFVAIFLSLYSILGFSIYQFQKSRLVDKARDQIHTTSENILVYLKQQPNLDEINFGTEYMLTDEMILIFLTDESQFDQERKLNQFANKLTTSDQVYLEQLNLNDQEILIAGIQSEYFSMFIYLPVSAVLAPLNYLTITLSVIAIFVILIFILFAKLLSKRVSKPLNRITHSARQMIYGEFHIQLPIESYDEIGELALAFNRMSRQLGNHLSTLQQEKDLLSHIIGSINDGVMTLNLDGDIIISNQAADHFLADLRYENASVELKELPDEFLYHLQTVINEGSTQGFQQSIQGRDWDIVLTPLYRKETIQGAVLIIRDITEQLKLDQLRETFIANISHELRTPISLLQGYSEAIIDGVAETVEEQRELATIINEESQRMARLVNELLDLTRLKAGFFELNIEKQSIHYFINRVFKKFSNQIKERDINLKYQIDDNCREIVCDLDRMEQVLTNLIDNAIKHTPVKGEINLEVIAEHEQTTFILTDTGSGIPKEDLPFVFERFYMADKSRSKLNRASKGTGLGLAIVKQIIDAHGGTIRVQSKQGEGTTFIFTIPSAS